MTAKELKARYSIFPKIHSEKQGNEFVASTIVRKKFDGKYYLQAVKVCDSQNQEYANHTIMGAAELVIKHSSFIHPDSEAAKAGCSQILDDNQND